MATIYYSVMGEGRGHAARARAMVERLRGDHRIVLFTSHDALAFLRNEYQDDPAIEVHEIPGLVFHYTERRIDYAKTIREGVGFWLSLRRLTKRVDEALHEQRPDLVISDFEPLLARAAVARGIPVLSLDHQHFLSTYDLSSLPGELRRWAWRMSWSIWAFGIGQDRTIVSAFYKPPLKPGLEEIVQVGPLLRRSVAEQTPTRGEHLLCYFRRATPQRVLDVLAAQPIPARVYGLGERPASGSLTFCKIDEQTFVEDLASCDAVISAAGNQLMGEAFYFGKPVLALPERSHFEQRINASFVESMGGGEQCLLERLTQQKLDHFLERRESYRECLQAERPCEDGCPEVQRVLQEMLGDESSQAHSTPIRESA